MITHDISTAASLTGRMVVLYGGRIVESGYTGDFLSVPRHPYTRGLLRSYPDMSATKDLQGIPGRMAHGLPGCPFHPGFLSAGTDGLSGKARIFNSVQCAGCGEYVMEARARLKDGRPVCIPCSDDYNRGW